MASTSGRGAPGAQPNRGIDPVVVQAALVQALIARNEVAINMTREEVTA